ncbi:histidinolphosphatase [Aspergillus brasiliensis]|nr:histidinolphosphatase [Aspergillus brasiliensis]
MKPMPFPFALNIGTDIVHLPRITRLLARPNYLTRFTHRILHAREQQDFRTRFSLPALPALIPSSSSSSSPAHTPTPSISISPDMTRWLAGRFAAKEAARKAAPRGAAHISWKDVVVTPELHELRLVSPYIPATAATPPSRGNQAAMPFTHHSHSGQFCPGHAKDNLEEIIQLAISKKFHTFCLTEHMPRHEEDFYPEEIEAGDTESSHVANEAAYFAEATRLRTKYADQIKILIGFEIDWIRPASRQLIEESLSRHPFEFFMGSVHHTLTVPIDYDRPLYEKARALAGGTDELLFEAYFDEQLDMLKQVRPVVVGHFDLIRLKSDDPDRSFQEYPRVWEKILRNLDYVVGYGGLLEVNSAALRKGMKEPYPNGEICKEFLARGGRFCLSDDSHGLEQVGLNFHRVVPFMEQVGMSRIHYLELAKEDDDSAPVVDARFPRTQIKSVTLEEVKNMPFWRQ